jgi:hypothetical protein
MSSMAAIVPFTCAICGAKFHELDGGKCEKCGKLACRRHFRTGLFKPLSRTCSQCRKSAAAGPDQKTK